MPIERPGVSFLVPGFDLYVYKQTQNLAVAQRRDEKKDT